MHFLRFEGLFRNNQTILFLLIGMAKKKMSETHIYIHTQMNNTITHRPSGERVYAETAPEHHNHRQSTNFRTLTEISNWTLSVRPLASSDDTAPQSSRQTSQQLSTESTIDFKLTDSKVSTRTSSLSSQQRISRSSRVSRFPNRPSNNLLN